MVTSYRCKACTIGFITLFNTLGVKILKKKPSSEFSNIKKINNTAAISFIN